MSETTATVPQLPPPEPFDIYNGIPCELHTVRARGKGVKAGDTWKVVRFAIPTDSWESIHALAVVIGNGDADVGANLLRSAIVEMLNERLDEAAEESFDDSGRLNRVLLEAKFPETFVATSRKGGLKKKDIEEKLREIADALPKFINILVDNKGVLTEEESNELAQLTLDQAKYSQMLEKISRRGKKATK